jgi:hypothetical protein
VNEDVRKLLLLGLAVSAVAALLIGLVPQWLGDAAGPEVEIITALKKAESHGVTLDIPGAGSVVSSKVDYQRVSVTVSGDTALVTATLDFDGKLGATTVSSLGHERVPFVRKDGDWEPVHGFAPRLASVVATMEKRRRALEAGDLGALCFDADAGQGTQADLDTLLRIKHRELKATAWLIRSERDDVTVAEDYRVKGELPERPVDDIGTRRLTLQGSDSGQLCFAAGLM